MKADIQEAARMTQRSVSNFIDHVMTEWLQEHCYRPQPKRKPRS